MLQSEFVTGEGYDAFGKHYRAVKVNPYFYEEYVYFTHGISFPDEGTTAYSYEGGYLDIGLYDDEWDEYVNWWMAKDDIVAITVWYGDWIDDFKDHHHGKIIPSTYDPESQTISIRVKREYAGKYI